MQAGLFPQAPAGCLTRVSLPPAAARQSFKEHEALVYTQLAQLIKDGIWLKSYIAAVMRVEQTARPPARPFGDSLLILICF